MARFFAVCNANGPISVELDAESLENALSEFAGADKRAWIDAAKADAEDAFAIEGAEDMGEGNFADALREAGCEEVRDLDPVDNYHAGTSSHLAGGWVLWQAP